jgi:hypothetical protein
VKDGAFGKFVHNRALTPIEKQTVIRMNRDTLYSAAVFDLAAAPVTITLPDAGRRFMSMQVISEDHYCPEVIYKPGGYTFAREQIGTRYLCIVIRTLVDPSNPRDLDQVHTLQDAIKVNQSTIGRFEVPEWDAASQKRVRDALSVLGSTVPDSTGCPSPVGKPFSMTLRTYVPKDVVRRGDWTPSAVTIAQAQSDTQESKQRTPAA